MGTRPTISEPAFPNPFSFPKHQAKLRIGRARSALRGIAVRLGQGNVVSVGVDESGEVPLDQRRTRAMRQRLRNERGLVSRTCAGNRALLPLSGKGR